MKVRTPYGKLRHKSFTQNAQREAVNNKIQGSVVAQLQLESLNTGIPIETLLWMERAGIKKVTEEVWDEVVEQNPLAQIFRGPVTRDQGGPFQYYRRYEALIMPYSLPYLRETPLTELRWKHERNLKWFSPEEYMRNGNMQQKLKEVWKEMIADLEGER